MSKENNEQFHYLRNLFTNIFSLLKDYSDIENAIESYYWLSTHWQKTRKVEKMIKTLDYVLKNPEEFKNYPFFQCIKTIEECFDNRLNLILCYVSLIRSKEIEDKFKSLSTKQTQIFRDYYFSIMSDSLCEIQNQIKTLNFDSLEKQLESLSIKIEEEKQ